MESYSTRLLALIFALAIMGTSEAEAQPTGLVASAGAPLPAVTRAIPQDVPVLEITASEQGKIAWDCVPSYWWGYWTWAWQPCAWIDRSYVEGTIGAIAEAPAAEPATQSKL